MNSRNKFSVRALALFLCLAFALLSTVGCAGKEKDGEFKIVCSIFPIYDWTRNIVGDVEGVSVELLVANGADLHSYQASVSDIITLRECDLIICVGGESDAWIEQAIKEIEGADIKVLRLLPILGEKGLALHTAEGSHEHGESCEHSLDEHIWLSPKHAAMLCDAIAQRLSEFEPFGNKQPESLEIYKEKLAELELAYQEVVDSSAKNTLIFADRFPFRYLTEDYSLEYRAAFSSCSADSEASFETVRDLALVCDQNSIEFLLTVDGSSDSIASAIISATKSKTAKILRLNSMQSVTKKQIEGGADYIEIMKENLSLLKRALG